MQLTAYVNGQFLPIEEATVHIEDRGFQFADSVYEVIACLGGAFLDLAAHIERLQRSCEAIAIVLPMEPDELAELVRELYRRNPFDDAMLYIQITRGAAPRSHTIAADLTPTLVITARQLPQPNREQLLHGATAVTMTDIRWQRCDIKSTALLGTVLGKIETQRRGADEGFWLDDAGHVLEGCSTNIFAVIGGRLVTHPLDHRVLGGITRDMVIHLAREHALEVAEQPWKLDTPGLSECMITSTTSGVVPICHIDGEAIADGGPGPLTLQLRGWLLDAFDALRAQAARA